MAVQILGLRDYFDSRTNRTRKREAFFDKGWRADSVPELFKNLDDLIQDIPQHERYNLYYTAASCLEKRGRILESQSVLPIDIDDIDETKVDEYIPIVLESLGLKHEETGIVFSGNGLQFIVALKDPINDEEYFEEHRVHYKALCGKIAQDLFSHGLAGSVDPSVFSAARLLRLPNTRNVKPKKGDKEAKLLQGQIVPVDFNLVQRSGIPVVEYTDQISDAMLKRLPPPDTEGVLNGCDFIKWCGSHAADVSEPQWYALLSILGRLERGRDIVHQYSKGHPEYSEHDTDRKLEQAVTTAGPRTCLNIASIWDGCAGCANYQKCKSPIVIQSKEYIKTKDTGFYNIVLDPEGAPKKGKPNYGDLMKYFEQKHPFVTMAEGNVTYVWRDTHWEDYAPRKIDAFAEKHFDPSPNNQMCNEFRGKLQRNNIRDPDWFGRTSAINFANGTLDLETMDLRPHDSGQGFKYVLPFDHDSSQDCPRFTRFLDEVTCGDRQIQQVLLEYMGYSLSGIDPSIGQKALILVGGGSNGKSVFMDVLKYLAGKGNYATLSMGNEISKLENRYQLDGKLFNISEETPTNAMVDSTVFKALVTGGEVQARKLYCDAYSMKNNAKIIMACNELPSTRDLSHGMFRRLLLVPFKAKFDKDIEGYDPLIREKLYAEAPGIFNLVLQALLKFKRRKLFSDANAIDKEVKSYQLTNDDVLQWWKDTVIPDPSSEVALSDLFMLYKMDCEQQGIRHRSQVWFSRRVRDLVGEEGTFSRRRRDGKLKSLLHGYRAAEGEEEF